MSTNRVFESLLQAVSSIHTAECGGHHSLKWTNHCYSFHAEKRSRDDASYVCHQEGGYLAVINSKEEESFIAGYLHSKLLNVIL